MSKTIPQRRRRGDRPIRWQAGVAAVVAATTASLTGIGTAGAIDTDSAAASSVTATPDPVDDVTEDVTGVVEPVTGVITPTTTTTTTTAPPTTTTTTAPSTTTTTTPSTTTTTAVEADGAEDGSSGPSDPAPSGSSSMSDDRTGSPAPASSTATQPQPVPVAGGGDTTLDVGPVSPAEASPAGPVAGLAADRDALVGPLPGGLAMGPVSFDSLWGLDGLSVPDVTGPRIAAGPRSTAGLLESMGDRADDVEYVASVLAPFPVAGRARYSDDWGAPRSIPAPHPHRGTDIFAARDTPVIAASSGVLRRVATTAVGGRAIWLTGDDGTEYYYAHLESFDPSAVTGRRVELGQVLGGVGTSGNAVGTPPHLHFEIHPDGGPAVPPVPYLDKWLAQAAARLGVTIEPSDASGIGPIAIPGLGDGGTFPWRRDVDEDAGEEREALLSQAAGGGGVPTSGTGAGILAGLVALAAASRALSHRLRLGGDASED